MNNDDNIVNSVIEMYKAVSNGDRRLLERLLSSAGDVLCIGTDPEEFWDDRSYILKNLSSQSESGVKVTAGDVKGYSEGSVGWAVDEAKFVFPSGSEVSFRITFVFHLENNDWKILQTHCSIGVPNSELSSYLSS